MFAASAVSGDETSEAGTRRRSSSVSPCRSGQQGRIADRPGAERVELRGEMTVAAN
jgi:hypothetical protein